MSEPNILYGNKITYSKNQLPLGRLLQQSLRDHKNKVAQVDAVTGQQITFNELYEFSCTLATNLKLKNIKSGDIISIISENRLEYFIPPIATTYVGVICAPLNPAYTPDELIHGLNITKPEYVFCSERSLPSLLKAIKKCHFVKEVILFDDVLGFDVVKNISCRITLFSDWIKPLSPPYRTGDFQPHEFDSDQQTAVVMCSSGTTGLPKGVKLSNHNIETFLNTFRNINTMDMDNVDVLLGLVPFYHSYGYSVVLYSAVAGMKVIVLPRFEERLFLSSIEKYKVTILPLVPPLMIFLAKSPLVDNYDLSSVNRVSCGAAPVGSNTLNEVQRRLGVKIRQGYGMTELSVVATLIPPDVHDKLYSVGRVVDGAEAKVIDLKTGQALGPYKSGELCFRGPYVMQGYYNNDKATKETIDSDGWLHTGDVGYYDKEQYLYIVDRIKELIKYKGYQVAPAELEELIISLPGVKDVAVIGIPDELNGELPKAFVVKQPNAKITEEDICQFVASKLSSQKRLRGGVEFINEIPKNPSGKILRRVLRSREKSKL